MAESSRSRIPILLCIDVEPEGRAIDPEARDDWVGFEQAYERLAGLRSRLAAATGHPAHFSWFLRMDPQIEHVYGSAGWVARRYRDILREVVAAGDELGLHCHPWRWEDDGRRWISDFGDQRWIDHCVHTGFRAFRESLERPCRSFRFGDRWMNTPTLRLVEKLGARFDLTIEPGQKMAPLAEAFTGELTDYTDAPRLPYRPSQRDFQRPGRLWARALWEIPLTTGTAQWAFEALRDRAASDDEASCHERVARGGAFEGWHDRADEQAIAGWAFDASAPERVVAVDIYDGERRIARVDAGSFRADLLAAHKGDGRHAFELPLPEFLRDGNAHSIAVRVAGTDLSLGGTPHEVSSLPSGSPGPAFLTFFLAYNPAILRGMIESVLDRQGSPYLAMILRTSVMLPDERARVERNLDYLLSRHDVERMLIATPDEAIAALGRNGPSPRN